MSNIIELRKHKPTPNAAIKKAVDELVEALVYYSECLGQEDQEDPGLGLIRNIATIHIQAALAVREPIQAEIDGFFGESNE